MNKKGFTLIEILSVIIIIGIMSTIGIIAISRNILQSRDSSVVSLAKNYAESARSMRASDDFYYNPKNGEAIILPYSQADNNTIENNYETGYGEIIPSYCYVGIVNENNNYSYYVTQVDDSYHILDRVEYNSMDEDDILTGVEKLSSNNVKELIAPLSGFSINYGDKDYSIKAVRVKFNASYSQTENSIGAAFSYEQGNAKLKGTIKLESQSQVRLTVTSSSNNNITGGTYLLTSKSDGSSGYVGTWSTGGENAKIKVDIKSANENEIIFDVKAFNKVLFENIVAKSKTTLSGYFTSDGSYSSSNANIKGNISYYDTFATSGNFPSGNNKITINGAEFVVDNSEIVYVVVKKN